jgi:hypothetical protein
MTRIVRAYHILNDEGVPIAVIYPLDGVFPFPSKKPPEKVTQTLEKMPRIDLIHHPPMGKATIEQRDKAYR